MTLATSKDAATGEIVINTASDVSTAWTFVSNANVESASVQDDDYMYFGYWLQSPEDPNKFAVFYDGKDGDADDDNNNNNDFVVDALLVNIDDVEDSLTAKYEGGAAGMYVTRKLRIEGQEVDKFSPGSSGRFTAKAVLTAIFGGKEFRDDGSRTGSTTERITNIISGDITEFNDGNKDLDIKVKLNQLDITSDWWDS